MSSKHPLAVDCPDVSAVVATFAGRRVTADNIRRACELRSISPPGGQWGPIMSGLILSGRLKRPEVVDLPARGGQPAKSVVTYLVSRNEDD